jgi:hypothetical protein
LALADDGDPKTLIQIINLQTNSCFELQDDKRKDERPC